MTKLLQHLVSPEPYRCDVGLRRGLLISTRLFIRGVRAWHRNAWASIRRKYSIDAPCIIVERMPIDSVPVALTWNGREVEILRWDGPDIPRDHVDVWLVHTDQMRIVPVAELALVEVRGGVLVEAAA